MISRLRKQILSLIESRKINVFLLFLLMSFSILMFTKLSKNYTNTLAFKIEKINVPEEKVILNNSDSIVNVTLKTHGFKWFKYYLGRPTLTVDFSKDVAENNAVFICDNSNLEFIANRALTNQVELIKVSPKRLEFNFDVNLVKKVPVVLKSNIIFTQGFNISESYKLQPDSIKVIGPHSIAKKIEYVETEAVKLARVRAEFAKRKAERNKDLYDQDILTIHERDEIETDLLIANSELRLKQQELALRKVSSPINGVVVNRFSNKGEYVNSDPIMSLATLDPLHIDLLLPASYFGQIALEQELLIKPESDMIDARAAKVIIVDPLIDSASGTFRVQLVMSNPGNKIPAGIRCSAKTVSNPKGKNE